MYILSARTSGESECSLDDRTARASQVHTERLCAETWKKVSVLNLWHILPMKVKKRKPATNCWLFSLVIQTTWAPISSRPDGRKVGPRPRCISSRWAFPVVVMLAFVGQPPEMYRKASSCVQSVISTSRFFHPSESPLLKKLHNVWNQRSCCAPPRVGDVGCCI